MSLTCGCSNLDDYWEPGATLWHAPDDFKALDTKKRKRCCSCGEMIDIGSFSVEFPHFKCPDHQIECDIYGEDGEIPRASRWMCETCGEHYFNLSELGYCVGPYDDMREMLAEYHRMVEADRRLAS